MFLFGGKIRFIPAVVFAVAALVSCSNTQGVQEIEVGSCTPAVATAGDPVVCQAKDLAEDCTLFFGKTPVAYERNASDGTLKFTVPPTLAGEVNVTARCGEGSQIMIQDGFSVVSSTLNPEAPASETSPEVADGGEIITPSAPAAVPSETPSAPETAPQSPESAPTGSQAPASLTVEKAADAVHFSAHRIGWSTGNAKAAYLAGNVFTRFWTDKGSEQPCGLTADGRYLVTDPDGTDLDPGSTNFDKAEGYREGTICQHWNCPSDFYDGADTLTPFCRIDLTKETGQIFVRSLTAQGRVCLAVQGDDNSWKTSCKNIDAPKPELIVTANSIAISPTKPVITLQFGFDKAMGRPSVAGCTETSGSYGPDQDGKGSYQGECPLTKIKTTLALSVQGAGGGNVASRSFEVVLWKNIGVSLKFLGRDTPNILSGESFLLRYGISRTYSVHDVQEGKFIGEFGACPWVKAVRFKGFPGDGGFHPVTGLNDVEGDRQAALIDATPQTKDWAKWSYVAEDFDGTYEAAVYQIEKPGSQNKFSLHTMDNGGDIFSSNGDGECDNGYIELWQKFAWSGKNVQSFSVQGEDGQNVKIWTALSQMPSAGPGMEENEKELKLIRDLGFMSDEWDADMKFKAIATFHDGTTQEIKMTVTGFGCH